MRYKLLGKSGVRVSELVLGTMTFGTAWGWGAAPEEVRRCSTVMPKQAAISSIPRSITPMAKPKPFSAIYCAPTAIISSSPPNIR